MTCWLLCSARAGPVWARVPHTQDLLSKRGAEAAGASPAPSPSHCRPCWPLFHLPADTSLLWRVCFLVSRTHFASPAPGPNWQGMESPRNSPEPAQMGTGVWIHTGSFVLPCLNQLFNTGILASGSAPAGTQTQTESLNE